MDGALAQCVHRDAGLVGARPVGEEAHSRLGAAGVDRTADVGLPQLVWAEAGLAGADLVVAQAGDAAVRQQFGELPHVADGADDLVVAVAVGRPAFRDQQRRAFGLRVLLMAVSAVDGETVRFEADLVLNPGLGRTLIRRAAGRQE